MAKIWIKTDEAQEVLRRLQLSLDEKTLRIAQSQAINKTLLKVRTVARTRIKEVYNISQKNIDGISISRANQNKLTGSINASRKPIPLDAFSPKQETSSGSIRITKRGAQKQITFKKAKSNPTAGVSIEIFKGKRQIIPFAFMIPGGAVRVFARGAYKIGNEYGFVQRHHRVSNEGNDNPIAPLVTVSQFGEILNEKVMKTINKMVIEMYPATLEKQIIYNINKLNQ